jgi:hypothetical protein
MDKVVRIIGLQEKDNDFAYWQNQTHEERLEAVEKIRQQYHQWKGDHAESRLQKVYTISQR